MNISRILAFAACFALGAPAFAAPPKPKNAPPKEPAPSLTVKDLALREARTCDANHNGKIDASEMSSVRAAQAKNPKSYLYLFDLNDNHYLDDSELSKIPLGPPPPKPAVAGAAPKPAPVHHAKRPSNPANHPHGGPR